MGFGARAKFVPLALGSSDRHEEREEPPFASARKISWKKLSRWISTWRPLDLSLPTCGIHGLTSAGCWAGKKKGKKATFYGWQHVTIHKSSLERARNSLYKCPVPWLSQKLEFQVFQQPGGYL